MAIEKELLDQLLAGRDPNEVFAKDGLLDDLKKALSERILNAELDEHLDGERVEGSVNRRAPPCNRQRPFFVAGDRQGFPLLVRPTTTTH